MSKTLIGVFGVNGRKRTLGLSQIPVDASRREIEGRRIAINSPTEFPH